MIIGSFIVLNALIYVSCNGPGGNQGKVKPAEDASETMAATSLNDITLKRGEEIYNKVCLACHQADGSGVPMMFPPVTQSKFINGDNEQLIRVILDGMSGPVEIKGEEYNSIMPPQKDNLDDQEVSDLIYYLRNSFSNSAGDITAEEVARIRKQ